MPWAESKLGSIYARVHGLRTPREEIAFTARPKIQSQSQIFRYGRSIFCLPHRPNFSDIFELCLHWVSVVRGLDGQDTKFFIVGPFFIYKMFDIKFQVFSSIKFGVVDHFIGKKRVNTKFSTKLTVQGVWFYSLLLMHKQFHKVIIWNLAIFDRLIRCDIINILASLIWLGPYTTTRSFFIHIANKPMNH